MSNDTMDHLVEVMLDGDDATLSDIVLLEGEKDDVINSLDGEATLMNYMMLFEEFLEEHDIYLFAGWEDAQFVGKPIVEKFWITFHILLSDKADVRGAKRVHDALNQGEVIVRKLNDGRYVARFLILKRDLDAIENANKERIDQLSDKALEEL